MYLYGDLLKDIRSMPISSRCASFGKSFLGKDIPYIKVGKGKRVLIHGGIHAREWVTVPLIMAMAREAAGMILGYEICFVPCVNPDGCDIAQLGSDDKRLISINGGDDFSLWKANANAVDLNINFDAKWGQGLSNVKHPAPANYIGEYPESEPETRALVKLTREFRPQFTMSYHALGREVYWEFGQTGERKASDREKAKKIADELSYVLLDGDLGSAGGYKDWCIEKLGIPAVTVEIISGEKSHPLCEGDLRPDIKRNLDLLKLFTL